MALKRDNFFLLEQLDTSLARLDHRRMACFMQPAWLNGGKILQHGLPPSSITPVVGLCQKQSARHRRIWSNLTLIETPEKDAWLT
jgi:hypothetical protein